MKKSASFVIVLILVGFLVIWYFGVAPTAVVPMPTPSVSETASPSTSEAAEGVITFTSQQLGIKFQYLGEQTGGMTTNVELVGDKIFLSVGDAAIASGQFVQVFSKETSETFSDAIRRQILANFPYEGCTITVTPSNIQSGYQTAEISYPAPSDPEKPLWDNAAKCNDKYAKTNGIRYFLYDPAHPTAFAYMDIGQYAIFAHDQIPWQDTLVFLP